jgi:recombination protein RecR
VAIEQAGAYKGRYHVLMGRLSPMEAIGAGELNIDGLLDRVKHATKSSDATRIEEVILGTNPTLEGDGTALYLAEALQKLGVKVTRLARGMPVGSSLQTVSKAVLSDAIQARTSSNNH